MNKKQVETLKDLELYYNKCRKIKLIYNEPIPIQQVIDEVIRKKYETYFVKGIEQCRIGCYRSLDDLFKVCKYYYPEISLSDIIKEIIIYSDDYSKDQEGYDKLFLEFCYCPNIRKDNFRGFTRYSWDDNFNKRVDKIYMYNQGFPNCNITLQEIIDN